jgi:hypothetical protein
VSIFVLTQQRIDERRIPDARRADECDGLARPAKGCQALRGYGIQCVEHLHVDAVLQPPRLPLEDVRLVTEIRFRQDDDGPNLRVPGQHQIPLQSGDIEVLIADGTMKTESTLAAIN